MNTDLAAWSEQFSDDVKPVLEAALLAVVAARPADDVAGIGIATDADAGSIVAFANSRANLERMVAEDPEFALDSKWHIGEWDLDLAGSDSADPLASVREQLAQAKLEVAPEAPQVGFGVAGMQEFRFAVWGAIARAMAASAREGFFDAWPAAAKVFMPLDADVDEVQLAAWSSPLNDDAGVAELRAFLQLT
ncbi:DUF4303 domain-containing protein [Agrococcus sp. Ld7]|uniref:DUF4303 domain-containing protein n=1 Tax=Agrococcus sp. Ld7 TaxID=649148 RepID=UPI0038637682